MAGEGLGRAERGNAAAVLERFADRFELLDVPGRGRGAVRIDVIDRQIEGLQRHPHAPHRAFARGLHHVEAVGIGTVA
jgi:hypothetical protein